MDIQLKRGLLDVCVLAAIGDSDAYGYQIIKDISPHVEITQSTLYPILRRLEEADCLSVRSEEYNGRLRKYYRVTPAGKSRIKEFKQDWAEIQEIYSFIAERTQAT
ncbi:MAG: PadR family transcriptional regulator [Clostridia bacterium]|nr:PadR family transcriptional regulator [Clostridia bacterium]